MAPKPPAVHDDFDDPHHREDDHETHPENDLWFLPGPIEEETHPFPSRRPEARPRETAVIDDWRKAEAANAARLARVAGRVGALDDRLKRGPQGWHHRLALIEAANLSWFAGDRVGADRLALWVCMHLSGVQDDPAALSRAAWAARRLTGGPGPEENLSAFLDRRDPGNAANVLFCAVLHSSTVCKQLPCRLLSSDNILFSKKGRSWG